MAVRKPGSWGRTRYHHCHNSPLSSVVLIHADPATTPDTCPLLTFITAYGCIRRHSHIGHILRRGSHRQLQQLDQGWSGYHQLKAVGQLAAASSFAVHSNWFPPASDLFARTQPSVWHSSPGSSPQCAALHRDLRHHRRLRRQYLQAIKSREKREPNFAPPVGHVLSTTVTPSNCMANMFASMQWGGIMQECISKCGGLAALLCWTRTRTLYYLYVLPWLTVCTYIAMYHINYKMYDSYAAPLDTSGYSC